MGAYLSKTKEDQEVNTVSVPLSNVQQQKVTFAEPLASDGQPLTAAAATEQVLQRKSSRTRVHRAPNALISVGTRSPRPKTARTPSTKAADPSVAVMQGVFPASAPAAASTPKATPRPRGRPPGTGKKARTAAAAAAPELVIVGKAFPQVAQPMKRQKGSVPAQKVNMKRVAKRALTAVSQKGGRGKKV